MLEDRPFRTSNRIAFADHTVDQRRRIQHQANALLPGRRHQRARTETNLQGACDELANLGIGLDQQCMEHSKQNTGRPLPRPSNLILWWDMGDIEDLFAPEQFDTFEVKLKIQNITSRTQVPESGLVQLTEIEDHHLALQLPPRSCALGHSLLIDLQVVHPKPIHCFQFSCTCAVILRESAGPDADRVRVQLVQIDDGSWKRLLELYASRQGEINSFLQAARGY